MENKTFVATDTMSVTLLTALVSAVVLAGVLFYLYKIRNRPENKRLRQIGAMLIFYGVLIALGTAVFSFWNKQKIIPLVFTEQSVQTPYGELNYLNIRDARIRTETQTSLANPNLIRGKTDLLVIIETSGKTHVLSAENYDIRAVLGELRKRMRKKDRN